jgi:hypothetical protein
MMVINRQPVLEAQIQRQARIGQTISEKAEEVLKVELASSALTNVPNGQPALMMSPF